MKNETILKINKFGKAGYLISKISKCIVIVVAVACLIIGIIMCFMPKDAAKIELTTSNTAVVKIGEDFDFLNLFGSDEDTSVLTLGGNTYKIISDGADETATVTNTFYLSNVKWICFVGVLACAMVFFLLYFAEKLCEHFKNCETPFTKDISKQLTNLAWSLIPACILPSLIQSFVYALITGRFDFTLDIDIITVLLILCVFMLSYIFKHGAVLQTESDETL